MAIEAEQSLRDVIWLSEHHPDVVETMHAYLSWRAEQQKQASKKKGR